MFDRQTLSNFLLGFGLCLSIPMLVISTSVGYMVNLAIFGTAMWIYAAVTQLLGRRPRKFRFQPLYLIFLAALCFISLWAIETGDYLAWLAWGLSAILSLRINYEPEPEKTGEP